MVVPTGFPQPLEIVSLLCCAHAGPPPLFEQTSDRRMEWSPVWQPSSSSWLHQWLCVSCSRTVQTSEIGDIHHCRAPKCGVSGVPVFSLVRDIESLMFKSSFGCQARDHQWKFSRHLQSLSPQSELALLLQNSSSWVGAGQEMCIPAHVSESLEIWLAQQCEQFGQGVPTAIPAGHPSPFLLTSGGSTPLPRSPFQNVPPAEERPSVSSAGGPTPMQVSHPFVTIPDVTEGVQCATPAPQSSNHTLLNFPEGTSPFDWIC